MSDDERRRRQDEPDDEGEDDEPDDEGEDEDEDEDDEGEDEELERLRGRVTELEGELERLRRASAASSWASWILGTFAAAAGLALVVLFLGNGFPVPRGPSRLQGAEPDEQGTAQQEALYALLNDHADELQRCFDQWARSAEARPGTIVRTLIEVEAGPGGAVGRVQVSGDDVPPSFGACLERAVGGWTFPSEGLFALEAPFEVRGGGAGGAAEQERPGAEQEAGPAGAAVDASVSLPTGE